MALFRQKKYDEAVSAYDKALEQDPDNVRVLNNKGYSLFRAKRLDEAIFTLTGAVSLQPDHPLANLNLAKALCAAGNHKDAQKIATKAINLNPEFKRIALTDGEFIRVCKPILPAIDQALHQN